MYTTELKYALVRYMLNDFGDEAANIGIAAVVDDPPRVILRSLVDPTVKSREDARVDRDAVARFVRMASDSLDTDQAPGEPDSLSDRVFGRLGEISGGVVRIGSLRSALTNDVDKEVEQLFHRLVEPSSTLALAAENAQASARDQARATRNPMGGLKKEASTALLKAFREGYGHQLRGDRFRRSYAVQGAIHKSVFDLLVRTGTESRPKEHLFHHVLLLPNADETVTQAAGLGWRWRDVRKANGADRKLTAIPYHRDRISPSVAHEAARILEREHIQVVAMADLPAFAETVVGQGKLAIHTR